MKMVRTKQIRAKMAKIVTLDRSGPEETMTGLMKAARKKTKTRHFLKMKKTKINKFNPKMKIKPRH